MNVMDSSSWIDIFTTLSEFPLVLPLILVGCFADMKQHNVRKPPISFERGEQIAKHLGAKTYMECSAKTLDNVDKVMEMAVHLGMKDKYLATTSNASKPCNIQ